MGWTRNADWRWASPALKTGTPQGGGFEPLAFRHWEKRCWYRSEVLALVHAGSIPALPATSS